MQRATFEESEFEDALYNQLERGSHLLWSPGQVLEGRIGFDRSLLVGGVRFWQWLGFTKPLRGAALSRYWWPAWWRPIGTDRTLPSFRQNLFIQAKRSEYSRTRPRSAKLLGSSGATWAFSITPKQQKSLSVLATTTAGRALVAYAGPAFHTRRMLFAHTRERSIVSNSTFPAVAKLAGHSRWYYQRGGTVGVANPDPELIDAGSLERRLEEFWSRTGAANVDLTEELGFLDKALVNAVEEAANPQFNTDFLRQRLLLERFAEGVALDTETYHYLLVVHAVETLNLSWWVVGSTVIAE